MININMNILLVYFQQTTWSKLHFLACLVFFVIYASHSIPVKIPANWKLCCLVKFFETPCALRRSSRKTITPHGFIGMESPSPRGPSPPSGPCRWPSSPLGACSPPPVWALCRSGWAGRETGRCTLYFRYFYYKWKLRFYFCVQVSWIQAYENLWESFFSCYISTISV